MAELADDLFLDPDDAGDLVAGDVDFDIDLDAGDVDLDLDLDGEAVNLDLDLGTGGVDLDIDAGDVSFYSYGESLEEYLASPDPFAQNMDAAASSDHMDLAFDDSSELDPALSSSRSPPLWDCLEVDAEGASAAEDLAAGDGFEWEEVASDATGGGDGAVGGFLDEREMQRLMDGIDSDGDAVDDASNFSDEPPFVDDVGDFGDDLGAFQSVGWEMLPVPLGAAAAAAAATADDGFEVLAGHLGEVIAGAPPASRAVVERLPLVLLGADEASGGCAVCKDSIAPGERATQLPCNHQYHGPCIRPWLAIRNTCPVCRYELPTDDPEYERWRARRASSGGSSRARSGSLRQV